MILVTESRGRPINRDNCFHSTFTWYRPTLAQLQMPKHSDQIITVCKVEIYKYPIIDLTTTTTKNYLENCNTFRNLKCCLFHCNKLQTVQHKNKTMSQCASPKTSTSQTKWSARFRWSLNIDVVRRPEETLRQRRHGKDTSPRVFRSSMSARCHH